MAQTVVEFVHKHGVFVPSFGSGHFLHRIALPQSAAVAEGGETAFGTDTGTGEHDYFLFHGEIQQKKGGYILMDEGKIRAVSETGTCANILKNARKRAEGEKKLEKGFQISQFFH